MHPGRAALVVVPPLLVMLWLLPSLIARSLLPALVPVAEIGLRLEGVRPTFPLGVRIRTVTAKTPRWSLEIADTRLIWLIARFRGEASLAGGVLRARGTGLGGTGRVRLEGIQVAELPVETLAGFEMRGRADGVVYWGEQLRWNLWIAEGELRRGWLPGLRLPFSLLVLEGELEPPDAWHLTTIQLHGTPLTLDGKGTLGARGELALELTIRALDDEMRSALGAFGLRIGRLPRKLAIEGTLRSPRFRLL